MRSSHVRLVLLVVLASATLVGCVISEQTGHMPQRLPGHGRGDSAAEDVTSGYEWMRGLPDWRTMTISTTDGMRVELDVERLSIEQRQGLLSAIVRYGGLVRE